MPRASVSPATPSFLYSPYMHPADYSSDEGDSPYTPFEQHNSSPLFDHGHVHKPRCARLSDPNHVSPRHLSPAPTKHLHPSFVEHSLSPLSPMFSPTVQQHNSPDSFSPSNSLSFDLDIDNYNPPLKDETADFSDSSFLIQSSSHVPYSCTQLNSLAFTPELASPSRSRPSRPRMSVPSKSDYTPNARARIYNERFPADHYLNPGFVQWYQLGDELGAGGYGFVMTARQRLEGLEVAVKFIIKDKVPSHAWMEDKHGNKVPTEALLLGLLDHDNIVKCVDLFEDDLYFYLVQELHGTPWVKHKDHVSPRQATAPGKISVSSYASTPALTPSPSADFDIPLPPSTPLDFSIEIEEVSASRHLMNRSPSGDSSFHSPPDFCTDLDCDRSFSTYLEPSPSAVRPSFVRRPSHDLFECIEQSAHKRLSEDQARYIFAQVVEAVHYLDSQGVSHCDIKDENILVDKDLRVKLVDFGSAVVVDPTEPRPYYTLFFGTTAYAASEVLQKKPYQAPPVEIWTLGVLLSYLLTGASPFPTERDAIAGRVVLSVSTSSQIPSLATDLMLRCLEPEPEKRADIGEVRAHPWLQGTMYVDVTQA
ncbi:kinase-like protein [Dentipellis sp. KUC8613]|nr:kinase-like protein [Dentipellis sp. KUC8613]